MRKCIYCGRKTETTGLLCNTCAENSKKLALSASVTETGELIKATEENRPEAKEIRVDYPKDAFLKFPADLDVQHVRSYNVGESDYAQHKIQPWDIWIEYKLNPFDADIIKRVLRHKKTDSRKMDYEKIIHICQERIRQIETGINPWGD